MTLDVQNVLDSMLRPKSVAVIGASSREGSLGNTVMKKILGFGFRGKVYPINPKAQEILGLKAYPNVVDVKDEIDTAVICVPGRFVNDVIDDLHKKGVKSCTIISAGFKEIGKEGIEREKILKEKITKYGIRVMGPNCFGFINGAEDVSLDCTFARNFASKGNIGFVSQSGAFGACVNEDLRRTKMGLSLFVSLGNRVDLDENEVLEYLYKDPNTKVIFMYLENFADPVKFLEIAKKITKEKPIIAIKAGKSVRGQQAVASHTGQLAQSERMVDALMEKAGVIRVNSVSEMIMAAKSLYSGVMPPVEDLAIITNAGGFGVMATDKAEELGVKLASFSDKTKEFLENNLPEEASCHNPVDLLGTATDEHYGIALEGVLGDPNVGGVVYNFGPPVMQKADPIAQKAAQIGKKYPHKPILSIFMNRYRILEPLERVKDEVFIPQFDYPEDAVWSYSKLLEYKRIKERKEYEVPALERDKDKVSSILKRCIKEGRKNLNFDEAEDVLRAYGIPMVNSVRIKSLDEIDDLDVKYPVAIKPLSGMVVHKTELGAVMVGIKNKEELKKAAHTINERIEAKYGPYNGGFVIQEMAEGVEVIAGAIRQEPSKIHLVMFGLGGIFVELLKDVTFAIPPLSLEEAETMVKRIKGYKLLSGFRGKKGVNLADLHDILIRLSALVCDFPEISEIDINPIFASSESGKTMGVDVRIIL